MRGRLLAVEDLRDEDVSQILRRAREHQLNRCRLGGSRQVDVPVVGLAFFQTSLRTRVGFASACARLGWSSVCVTEQRQSATSMAESIEDSLRVLAGQSDVVVTRLPAPISVAAAAVSSSPLINAGDGGLTCQHPTQALIDLFTIEAECGPLEDLRVLVCGDLRGRSARSLFSVLTRFPPASLAFISTPALYDSSAAMELWLSRASEWSTDRDLSAFNVVYVTGIPHQAIPEDVRDTLRITMPVMSRLRDDAVVLSPMPVIDEIDAEARLDRRMRFYRQSDNGLPVRMAILEWAIAGINSGPF